MKRLKKTIAASKPENNLPILQKKKKTYVNPHEKTPKTLPHFFACMTTFVYMFL